MDNPELDVSVSLAVDGGDQPEERMEETAQQQQPQMSCRNLDSPPPKLSECTDSSPPPPVANDVQPEALEDDGGEDNYDSDSDYDVCDDVMNLLNFSVVPRPSRNAPEVPVDEELIPKSQYLHERRQLMDMVKVSEEQCAAAESQMIAATCKLRECQQKQEQIVEAVRHLHGLYGQVMKTMATSMCNNFDQSCTPAGSYLSVGPFPSSNEVVRILQMFSALTVQFQNNNYTTTKQMLEQLDTMLNQRTDNIVPLSTETAIVPVGNSVSGDAESLVPPPEQTVVELSPDPPPASSPDTVVATVSNPPPIPDAHGFPSLPDLSTPPPPPQPASAQSVPPPQMHLSESEPSDNTSAFVPVLDMSQTPSKWSLMEVPQSRDLRRKPHGTASIGAEPLSCICGDAFGSATLLRFHVRYFSATWKYTCTICSRKYPGQNFLKLHYLREHNMLVEPSLAPPSVPAISPAASTNISGETGPYQIVVNGDCCACGTSMGSSDALMEHIREEAKALGQSFTCNHCSQEFNHPCSYKKHLRDIHPDKYFVCSWCDDVFGTLDGRDIHVHLEHRLEQSSEGVISNQKASDLQGNLREDQSAPGGSSGDANLPSATVTITIVD